MTLPLDPGDARESRPLGEHSQRREAAGRVDPGDARESRPLGEHSQRREAAGRVVAALQDAPLPGEGAARERARRTVLAAHAASPQRRRPRTAAVVTAVALAVAGAGGLTRPGQAVAEWFGRHLEVVSRPAAPVPAPAPKRRTGLDLPTRGRLLVVSERKLWIVDRDGTRTGLGSWTSGSWSPRGYYVAGTSGRTLAAIRPDGTVRWRHAASARVADPRWSPDGLNVAYRAGSRLHLIWANGLHDVALPGRAAPAAPAWRPADDNTVAWARADGTVLVQDAYTGLVLWGHRGGPVRRLSWSADGKRLLIAGRRHGAVYSLAGGPPRSLRLRAGEELAAAAFAPAGGRLAIAVSAGGVTRVSLLGSKAALVEAPGRLRSLTWSPDGHWLLAPSGDEWLLARARGGLAVASVSARRFGAPTRMLGWSAR